MGLFSRKTTKHGHAMEKDQGNQGTANGTVKSPRVNGSPAATATIPDIPLPRAPDPALNPAGYLRSIYAVRERSKLVLEKAKRNQLRHFQVDMSKFPETARYVVSIIKVRNQAGLVPCFTALSGLLTSE